MTRGGIRLLFILLLAISAGAAPLNDYSSRLDGAKSLVDQTLKQLPPRTGWEDGLSKQLSEVLPRSEKIEVPGGAVETDNAWLAGSLERLRNASKIVEKRAILSEISERLAGIQSAVTELQSSKAAQGGKDRDKQSLAEILRRPEYQKAVQAEESVFHRAWREFWDWVESVFPSAPKMPAAPAGVGGLKTGLQILIFIAVLGLIGFLVYKFAPGVLGKFGGKAREGKGDRVILGEHVSADESSSDLFAEAERLAREGDLRGAIRKGYIAVLCELGDRNVLRLARHKTNRDYLRDVRPRADLYPNMTGLTGRFEKSWYGQTRADQSDWEQFKAGYQQAVAAARGRA